MVRKNRLQYTSVDGADELFTPDFNDYLVSLHDQFSERIYYLREKRARVLEKALGNHLMPNHLPKSDTNTKEWVVEDVPEDLQRPGIEISGPASITSMFINALNPDKSGARAEGYLDDDEDSAGHRLVDTVSATHNRLGAVQRTLEYYDSDRNREYKIEEGEIPFFMHRERGLHLDEQEVTIDNKPVSAAILGTALTLFYAGKAQIERGQGVYWYLPKLESAEEAHFWREFFDFSRTQLSLPDTAVIKCIPLVESLPLAYQMEEALYALGPYAAGLNAARWDLKASVFEFIMTDPDSVWPDRFQVDIKTTDFLANIFRRLVAICLKHGAVPIGGMATALPNQDAEVNETASASIRTDKEWEASQGFIRAWVAHIFHMKTAANPFKELRGSGWLPSEKIQNPDNYPIHIDVPEGPITIEGTRRNARMLIEYLEGWMNGRGAKGIDSLDGKPGIHPALMEDLATGRMSAAQIAQRIIHSAQDTHTGQTHDYNLVSKIVNEEVEDILTRLRENSSPDTLRESEDAYRKSAKIAKHWIKNYTELNFRSLGSYTHKDLEKIASDQDVF